MTSTNIAAALSTEADFASEFFMASTFPHAQGVNPINAWYWVQTHGVLLVDVRTAEERKFVGHVPGSHHVPWAMGTALNCNPGSFENSRSRPARIIRFCCCAGAASVRLWQETPRLPPAFA